MPNFGGRAHVRLPDRGGRLGRLQVADCLQVKERIQNVGTREGTARSRAGRTPEVRAPVHPRPALAEDRTDEIPTGMVRQATAARAQAQSEVGSREPPEGPGSAGLGRAKAGGADRAGVVHKKHLVPHKKIVRIPSTLARFAP